MHDRYVPHQGRRRMLLGYMRVSKADGSQLLDVQRDAVRARGRHGGRPRKMTPAALRMVMAAMAERTTNATEVAYSLGLNRTTLYLYVNGDGTPKARGQALLTGQDHRG